MEVFEPPTYFSSRRIKKNDVVKPWYTEPRNPREKWVTIVPFMGILLGFVLAGLLTCDIFRSVINHKYCLVFEEDFSKGLNPDVRKAEITLGNSGYCIIACY